MKHSYLPTELKVSIYSLGSRYYNLSKTKVSFNIPIGYLESKLLNTNVSSLIKIEVQDIKELKDAITLAKLSSDRFRVAIENDCYFEEYTTLAEAVATLINYVQTNILEKKGTLQ